MTKKRDPVVDVAKGIGIILVVVGHTHAPTILHNFIYLFHMPLFFVLSGWVSRDVDDYKWAIVRRIKSLYVPFVSFGIAFLVVHNLLVFIGAYENRYGAKGACLQLLRILAFSVGLEERLISPLWFLKALFVAEMLFIVQQYFFPKFGRAGSWMFFFASAYVFLPFSDSFPFLKINIIVPLFAAAFFFLGRHLVIVYKESPWMRRVSWGLLPLMILVSRDSTNDLISLKLVSPPLFLLFSVAGICVVMSASNGLAKFLPLISNAVAYVGKNSLWIMSLHLLSYKPFMYVASRWLGEISLSLYENLGSRLPYGWIACVVSGVLFPLCVASLWRFGLSYVRQVKMM